MSAWPRSLHFTSSGAWGSWYCPHVLRRYVAICKPCGTQPSWASVSVVPGETGLDGVLYPFFSTDSLGFEITLLWLTLLITISVICNLCWNLLVWILMSSTYSQCLTVGPYAWWVSCCCLSPMVSSYILWVTVAQKEEGKPLHAPPTLLLLSYSLCHVYTYMLAL